MAPTFALLFALWRSPVSTQTTVKTFTYRESVIDSFPERLPLKIRTLLAPAIVLPLVLTSCSILPWSSSFEHSEDFDKAQAQEAIDGAGGLEALLQASESARAICHEETKYGGNTVAESASDIDEFSAIYVEDQGDHLRYLFAGTALMESYSGEDKKVAYVCAQVQAGYDADQTAASDEFHAIVDDAIYAVDRSGYMYKILRDYLRETHSNDGKEEPVVYVGEFSDVANGWDDDFDFPGSD